MFSLGTLRKECLCPAHIHIRISETAKEFIVSQVDNTHNHYIAEVCIILRSLIVFNFSSWFMCFRNYLNNFHTIENSQMM
ncbi:hypothetical protein NQ314_016919 [Rhamnusium bicolor]|uniref:FAR1 domain-containing protein n=1 Tax=Rhamnusium bicolor TaxID=1586634 RepID=A0AAV8WVL8_9CUCU|nr:hypothetical protein NQ314_016919 [Rhamnusium bicolor]